MSFCRPSCNLQVYKPMSLDGVLYPMVVEEARLKPGVISTHKGPARNMSELKNAAKLAYATHPQLQCIKV